MFNKNKISYDELFVPYSMMENNIKETDIPKITIEEQNSELIMEVLHGTGKIIFKNGDIYEGSVRNGILDSVNAKFTFKNSGIIYQGTLKDNTITGKGNFTFTKSKSRYILLISVMSDMLKMG
jgi:hypothetical protein